MDVQNEAFLMKITFNIIKCKNTLWVRFLQAKYKTEEDVPITIRSQRCSKLWKGIGIVWQDVRNNITHVVGNGHSIDFWMDKWIPNLQPLFNYVNQNELSRAGARWFDGYNWYKGLQRVKIFLWTLSWEKLMTNPDRLKRHSCCADSLEDINHVFRKCNIIYFIWVLLIKQEKLEEFMSMDIKSWIHVNMVHTSYFAKDDRGWEILFGAILWNTWRQRNAIIFDSPLDDNAGVLEHSWIKLNIDGARRDSNGFASCGGNHVADNLARSAGPEIISTQFVDVSPDEVVPLLNKG
ncbi:hypothetical protein F3Y22_tig00112470pilonHSYRG00038 [Hibiscus syriacus]|uniref:Reverse transcriptase zinc-binding domain-containing protein n=1 Tax=Hibiscus syriacus TaxID=106335 RepID=A0A6A2XXN1_HIBSY|nr:hypothetical protein F3Y22_tig00112470pilonHSYRG00038 [Hibiscus syriacus]